MRITKDEMIAATGTPNETGARLDWTLQCYAEMEIKLHAARNTLARLADLTDGLPFDEGDADEQLIERAIRLAHKCAKETP